MRNKISYILILSSLIVSLVGCGAVDDTDENYANYSQDAEITTISESVVTSESSEITKETSETAITSETSNNTDVTTTIKTDTTTTKQTTKSTTTSTTTKATTKTTTKATTHSNQNVQEPSNDNVQQKPSNDNVQQPENNDTQPPNTVATTPEPSFDASTDMNFNYNNYSFSTDVNMNDIVANLGDPISLDVAPSCYYNGDDKIYHYDGFNIYTYTLDGVEYYSQLIELTGSNVSTSKGITVGSSLADIESTYGTGYQVIGNEYRFYSTDTSYLYFFMIDGTVSSIGYVVEIEV